MEDAMEVTTIEVRPALPAFVWTDEQRAMIRATYASGASDAEFAVLIDTAASRGLDPRFGQVHFVKRWNSQQRCEVWSIQPSIDGMRSVAESTGLYDGQDEPEFVEGEKGLLLCKVRVYRKDWARPCVGIAYWAEYVQTTKDGAVTTFWKKMPHVMLAKCAEAIALRKAFPHKLAGMYAQEEMMQADNEEREEKPRRGLKAPTQQEAKGLPAPGGPSPEDAGRQRVYSQLHSVNGLGQALECDRTLKAVCETWLSRQADIAEEDVDMNGESRGVLKEADRIINGRVIELGLAKSPTEAGKLVKECCFALAQAKQAPAPAAVEEEPVVAPTLPAAYLEALAAATSPEEAVEVYREHGPAISLEADGKSKTALYMPALEAVRARCVQLMVRPEDVAAWVKTQIAKGAPKGDGPKGGKRSKPTAAPASAQGSSAETTQGNGAQASVSYLVPNIESARYVASAAEWEAHCLAYKSKENALNSWAKHVAAFRSAGVFAERRHVAALRYQTFTGALDVDVAARGLDLAERTAEANARKHVEAAATLRKAG